MFLNSHNISSTTIHGDKSQGQRSASMKDFSSGNENILIATNVASRGLHIDDIKLVINYDMPSEIDDYVHRIGRTGRLGKKGMSITFITPSNNFKVLHELKNLLLDAKLPIPAFFSNFERSTDFRSSYNNQSRFGARDFRFNNSFDGGKRNDFGNFRNNNDGQFRRSNYVK